MSVFDVWGRLFGRWNLIDAVALIAVVLLLVLGYGAYLLFRLPAPSVSSITPGQVFAQQAGTLHVTGEQLRPFLTVRLGSFTAPLLVASSTAAEVSVKGLEPGTYDFVLLEEVRELLRVPDALTVLPSTSSATGLEMQAVGAFVFLTEPEAERISKGHSLDEGFNPESAPTQSGTGVPLPIGTVLAVLPPEINMHRLRVGDGTVVTIPVPGKLQVPAIVRFRCRIRVDRCQVGDIDVVRDALVPLALSVPEDQKFTHPVTQLRFRIDEIRPATAEVDLAPSIATARVRVKFVAGADAAGLPRAGDKDTGVTEAQTVVNASGEASILRAAILSVDTAPRPVVALTQMEGMSVQETMATLDVTLTVPVMRMSTGWEYAGRPVKVGARFRFEGRAYAMDGWVLAVQIDPPPTSRRPEP